MSKKTPAPAFLTTVFSRRLYSFILMLTVTAAVISCSSRLTTDNLAHIKNGMSSTEVVKILGKPTQTDAQSALGISGVTYVYRNGQSEVKIVFLNDKVTAVQSHLQ